MKNYVNNLKSFSTGNLLLTRLAIVEKDRPKVVKTDVGYKVVNQKRKRFLLKRMNNK